MWQTKSGLKSFKGDHNSYNKISREEVKDFDLTDYG